MSKNRVEYFTHIPALLSSEDNSPMNLAYGTSPVILAERQESRSYRKVARILRGTVDVGILAPTVKVASSALIHTSDNTVFAQVKDEEENIWFVHPRVLIEKNGNLAYGNESALNRFAETEELCIISGTCLYGASSVKALGENGIYYSLTDPLSVERIDTTIMSLEVPRTIHPYEMETILRLTNFFRTLNKNKIIRLFFHVPRLEYGYHALFLYEKGLMSSDTLFAWVEQVSQHSKQMEKFLRKLLPPNIQFQISSPLLPVENVVVDAVKRGKHGVIQEAIHELTSDTVWDSVIAKNEQVAMEELASIKELTQRNPHYQRGYKTRDEMDFIYLSSLSYIVGYLQALHENEGLLVAIENPEETSIIEGVKVLTDDIDSLTTILAFYVHPNLLLPQGTTYDDKRCLFYLDENTIPRLKALGEIVLAYKNKSVRSNIIFERQDPN